MHALILALMTLLEGCGGRGGSRQEDITALRGLGFAATPLVTTPSGTGAPTQVHVIFYAAVPLGQTATVAPFVDSGSSEGALTLRSTAIHLVAGSETYKTYSGFQLYSTALEVDIPTAAEMAASSPKSAGPWSGGQILFGLSITANGTTENSIANLNVFPAGSPQLAWQNPTLTLTAPSPNASVSYTSTVGLVAAVADAVSENGIVGWFVGNGSVSNRRAESTTWDPGGTGPQSIAVVYHGVSSRGFALQVINVNVTN